MKSNRGQRATLGIYDDCSGICALYDGISLEHYKPSDGEVIVARYKFGEFSLDVLQKQYEMLKDVFCDNSVLMLPDNISFEQLSRDDLIRIRNTIDEMICV